MHWKSQSWDGGRVGIGNEAGPEAGPEGAVEVGGEAGDEAGYGRLVAAAAAAAAVVVVVVVAVVAVVVVVVVMPRNLEVAAAGMQTEAPAAGGPAGPSCRRAAKRSRIRPSGCCAFSSASSAVCPDR